MVLMKKFPCACEFVQEELPGQPASMQALCEATALDHLGQVLSGQGKYEEALELFQLSLTTKIRNLGAEWPTVANSLDNVAELYRIMGEYEDALALKKEALSIRKSVLGLEHTDTATSYNNIGLVLQNMGRLTHAKPYFKKAVKTYEAVSSKDTTNMAAMLNNLAGSYRFQGKLDKAEALYQRSLTMRTRVLGPKRPAVAESLNNLAMVLKDAGKFEEAEEMSTRCLELAKLLMEPDRPGYLNYVGNHGIVLLAMGKDIELGKAYIQEALTSLLRRGFPETHVWIQKFRKHLEDPLEEGMEESTSAGTDGSSMPGNQHSGRANREMHTHHWPKNACMGVTSSCGAERDPGTTRTMKRVGSVDSVDKGSTANARSTAHMRSIENCRPSPVDTKGLNILSNIVTSTSQTEDASANASSSCDCSNRSAGVKRTRQSSVHGRLAEYQDGKTEFGKLLMSYRKRHGTSCTEEVALDSDDEVNGALEQ